MKAIPELLALARQASEAAEKATPGEWEQRYWRNATMSNVVTHVDILHVVAADITFADAGFMVLARSAVPELAAGVEWLAGQLAAMEQCFHDQTAEVVRLQDRQSELLALVAKISQSTPLDSEVSEALNQRGVMLAEIGTLRSQLAASRAEVERLRRACSFALSCINEVDDIEDQMELRRIRLMIEGGAK